MCDADGVPEDDEALRNLDTAEFWAISAINRRDANIKEVLKVIHSLLENLDQMSETMSVPGALSLSNRLFELEKILKDIYIDQVGRISPLHAFTRETLDSIRRHLTRISSGP